MRNRLIWRTVLALAAATALLFGQQAGIPAAPAQESPVQKQPQPKSQEELNAVQEIVNALDPDSRIKAAEELVAGFPDSEFKGFALQMATVSAQEKNDYEQMMIYGGRTLEADPDNYGVMLMMATGLAQRTREFDLDREEKLKQAEAYARRSMEIVETLPRPNPNVTDEQWEGAKRDFRGQAYEALGLAAMVRKNYDVAVAEFRTAVDTAATPSPTALLRLAAVLNLAGKYDEAIAAIDQLMEDTQLHPQIRSIAQAEKARAVRAKEGPAQPEAKQP